MRLVFFGSGAFGLPTLEALADHHDLAAIVSQPARPAGRKKTLTPTPIAEYAGERLPGVPLDTPENVNEPETIERLRGLAADAWVVIAYGQKLSNALLGLGQQPGPAGEIFTINLHGSILPRHRGASPIVAAVLAGDDEIGSSVIRVVSKMDAGRILAQSRAPLDPSLTAGEHHDELAADGPDLVLEVLERHASGTLIETEQDESEVTLAGKLRKADGVVDWSKPAAEIQRLIHAFNPWPGAQTTLAGGPLKLHRAEMSDEPADRAPGTLVDAEAGVVATGTRTLRLLEVQAPGGKPMPWDAFARGRNVDPGTVLGDRGAAS